MHRLRTSILLRRTERILIAALLLAAQAAFLWMFFSADSVEQFAGPDRELLRFASDWRHGTAGNAWIYMPGFFATAAAVWLAVPLTNRRPVWFAVGAPAVAAVIAAIAASAFGTPLILSDLERATGRTMAGTAPSLSAIGALRGVYTLVVWSVFVSACRRGLVERTWRPFIPAAVFAAGLALARPWTLGEVGSHWTSQARAGDLTAYLSAVAVPLLAGLLAASVQRSQSRTRPRCPTATRGTATANRA